MVAVVMLLTFSDADGQAGTLRIQSNLYGIRPGTCFVGVFGKACTYYNTINIMYNYRFHDLLVYNFLFDTAVSVSKRSKALRKKRKKSKVAGASLLSTMMMMITVVVVVVLLSDLFYFCAPLCITL